MNQKQKQVASNALVLIIAIITIGTLEYRALSIGIDGVLFSIAVGAIGIIAGVKGKDIRDIISRK